MTTLNAPTRERIFAEDNVTLRSDTGRTFGYAMIISGLIAVLGTLLAGFVDAKTAKVALHALHTGFLVSIGLPIGALIFVMILQATGAGWANTVRRQLENLMSLMWVGLAMLIAMIVMQAVLVNIHPATPENPKAAPFVWDWMNTEYVKGDLIYEHKQGFLNVPFFLVRNVIIYPAVLLTLTGLMWGYSRGQDHDGDPWRTARAGRAAAIGMLVFAFTLAFASFDWMMGLDFHWFSTMFPVYYFAGAVVSALAIVTLVLLALRGLGKLAGAFTEEHLHDLSKCVFAFVVFWAYVTFSQYFLIWYAGIPEETQFFLSRKAEGTFWVVLSWAIPIGHFILPFIILLPRPARRSPAVMAVMCVWLLVFHILDIYWMVRPEAAYPNLHILDFVGVLGPAAIMVGMLVYRIRSGPLMPLNDPREPEALAHKNYV